jgi:glycosyltransferase involved in cell wall biosynthesis
MHPGKGQDIALDVWSSLPREVRTSLTLFFVGQETDKDYAENLRRRISEAPDRERIVIVGPSEQPQEWIQSSDIFISGSLHEGMPLAPLEAAGAGLPVLLSNIDGHRFLQEWAHYFDPGKPEDGAREIEGILNELRSGKDVEFFEHQWNKATPLREQWGAGAMAASYAKVFQSGES